MADWDVAIVGGGSAGIAAARRLHGSGLSAILVEALPRLGGRAHTIHLGTGPLDMGAGWLHSARRNPWREIAEQLGFTIDRTPPAWQRQYKGLGFSDAEQAEAREAFRRFEARLDRDPPPSDRAGDALEPGGRWNAYLDAISGALNGAELSQVSARDFMAYEDMAGAENWRVSEGLGATIVTAAPAIEVRLETPVTTIRHGGSGVRLETPRGEIDCRAAIVTVSTSVLAGGGLRFEPALDDRIEAASRLPLGHVEKLFLTLDEPDLLPPDSHLIGDPYRSDTGNYYMRPFGRPVIEGFFGGAAADAVRDGGMAAATEVAIGELAALLGNDWRRRLRPIAWSGWCDVPSIAGAYSHALPGEAGARALLAAPVDGQIYFAGEACSEKDYSTTHGAYATGVKAAEDVIAAL